MTRKMLLALAIALLATAAGHAQELIRAGNTTDGGFRTFRMPNGDEVTYVYGPRGYEKIVKPATKTAAQIVAEAKARKASKPKPKPYVPMSAVQGSYRSGRGSSSFENSPYRYFYGSPR